MSSVLIFYGTLIYGECTMANIKNTSFRLDLPDDCLLYFKPPLFDRHWYRKDLTPVLIEDVPKEIKMLCLVMGIPLTP